MAETWLINETPDYTSFPITTINGTSNNISFKQILLFSGPLIDEEGNSITPVQTAIGFYDNDSNIHLIYGNLYKSGESSSALQWANTAYRTITFDTNTTGTLLVWLQTNAVKQGSAYKGLYIGSSKIGSVFYGSNSIGKIFNGTHKIFGEGGTTTYAIVTSLTNITADSSNPGTIEPNATATLTFTAKPNSVLPSSVTVTGATSSWNSSTGVLTISNPTDNVYITIIGRETNHLCFTANTAGSTVELIIKGSPSISDTAYSTDGSTWVSFTPSTTVGTNTITLTNIGDKVYFRNNINANLSSSNYMRFKMSGSISASGNCDSMYLAIGFNEIVGIQYDYCYTNMFWDCSSLTTAPLLPTTNLYGFACYQSMFLSCSSLTTAPTLPATVLSQACYHAMFMNCTSLTTAPSLPSIYTSGACYRKMFQGCTSLTTVPALPTTSLYVSDCYEEMFYDCTSLYVSDTQTSSASHAWRIPTSGTFMYDNYSQSNMFKNCLGTRSSDDMGGVVGQSYTYYTQNEPV